MMTSPIAEQVQESSGSTPPKARQAVDTARQLNNARPPANITSSTQLDMPPWEPSTGNLNINPVEPPFPGLAAGGLRRPPPTIPPGPHVGQTYLTSQSQYTAVLHPSPYPYPQHLYGTSQFSHHLYSHLQYTYTTPSRYYHLIVAHPGALEKKLVGTS